MDKNDSNRWLLNEKETLSSTFLHCLDIAIATSSLCYP